SRPWHIAMGGLAAGLGCAAAPRQLAVVALAGCCVFGFAARRPALALLGVGLVLAGLAVGHARLAAIDRPGARLRQDSEIHGEAIGKAVRVDWRRSGLAHLLSGYATARTLLPHAGLLTPA